MRWTALIAAAAVAIPFGFSPADGARRSRCNPAGSTNVFKEGDVRAFTRTAGKGARRGRYTFVCKMSRNQAFRLPASRLVGEDDYAPFATAGDYLGYAVRFACVRCDDVTARVYVYNLRTGRHHGVNAFKDNPDRFDTNVRALVVTAGGIAAWIVDNREGDFELQKLEGKARTRIDAGRKIDARSLRLTGTHLTWKKGKRRKATTLQ